MSQQSSVTHDIENLSHKKESDYRPYTPICSLQAYEIHDNQ